VTFDPPGREAAPAPYADAEALFRAAYPDLIPAAYRLLGNRADTEDAAQNTFHKLMVAWPKKVGGLPADEQRAYLIKIVINEARQILRRSYRSREFPGVDAGERASPSPSIEEKVQAKEELRLVWQAISELPGARRDVVTLRAAGYEYEEIAAELDIDISTVRSHISNARKQLSRRAARDWEGEQQ
jgi:RNA polymerase sigma-70 factor (ECF subfamily)